MFQRDIRPGRRMLGALAGRALLPGSAQAKVRRPRDLSSHCPSVSVVISCYNYGHYLPECVQSVLDQPGVRVDVIVVDDASPDGSADVARGLAAGDPRIRAICHTANKGHIATANEGMEQAAGDYLVLLSADDRLTPGCLARATSLMEEYPSVGLTYGCAVDFTDTDLPPARTDATHWIVWPGHDWIAHRCKAGRNVIRSPEAVMRTSVRRGLGPCNPDLPYSGDLELWMRQATVSDVGYVGGADQAYYRMHASNMHRTFDMLANISQRLLAFDTIFDERSALFADPQTMRNAAHRALARETLRHAISAYARGVADQEPIDDYAALALSTWPDARSLREWRALCRLRKMRDNRLRRDPSLITREALRSLRYSLGWWRGRWAGVD